MKKNLYNILGIEKTSSYAEIRKAYKKKAKETHPDAGGSDEEFKEVSEAYAILIDPDKRRSYDKTGQKPTSANRIVAEAYSLLSMLFSQVIEGAVDKFDNTDIIKMTKSIASKLRSDNITNTEILKEKIKKLLDGKNRGEYFDKAHPDLLSISFDLKIQGVKGEIASKKNFLRTIDVVLALLDGYKFRIGDKHEVREARKEGSSL